jgi:hypothetical protein
VHTIEIRLSTSNPTRGARASTSSSSNRFQEHVPCGRAEAVQALANARAARESARARVREVDFNLTEDPTVHVFVTNWLQLHAAHNENK